MEINKARIIKELGAGMFGTTYLIELNGKEYALKIQHILSKDEKESYKSELWREMDLYKYIESLPEKDQKFFTKLYGFQIIECDHIQKRPFTIQGYGTFVRKLKKLDSSKLCAKYLMDYHGESNLLKFLQTHKVNQNELRSIVIQVIKILLILYEGGYAHTDLHTGNIMIKPTDDKYFDFYGKKIPFNGYQIVSIDYGEIIHEKFGISYKNGWRKLFLKDRESFLFMEMFYDILGIISNFIYLMNDCREQKKKLPWERKGDAWGDGLKKIMINHPDFFKENIEKYSNDFPKTRKLLQYLFDNRRNKKRIDEIMKVKKVDKNYFYLVLSKIQEKFNYFYPNEYAKYFKWCSVIKIAFPEKKFLDFLDVKNYNDIINWIIN